MARGNFNTMWRYTNAGGKRAATRTIDTANDGDTIIGQDSIVIGSSTTAESHTSQTEKALAGYVTCSATSGSTSYEPWYFYTTLTGAGQVGGRLKSHTYSNVASGAWVNAIKGHMEFGSSGSSTGLASAIVAEMTMPNASLGSGQYYPLEIEMEFGASTDVAGTSGCGAGFIYAKINGTATDFDDEAGLFWINGITAGAGHLLSAHSVTLRSFVTSSMTAKYLVMSSAEDCLTLPDGVTTGVQIGNATTGLLLDGDMTDAIKIAGSNTIVDGIEINACTNAINVAGNVTTGYLHAGTATNAISITGATTTSAINVTATDTAGTYGIYLKKTVTGFAGSSYYGAYIRGEAATNAATAKSMYGAMIYGVSNAVTHTTGSLWGTFSYAYVKGDAAQTINNIYGNQTEFSMDAGRSNNLTITTEAAVQLLKVTAGKMADDTKLSGQILRFGDMDGDSATFNRGIFIEDDGDMSGTCLLTTGMEIEIGTTTGINISGTCSGTGLVVAGSLMGVDLTTSMTGASAINGNEFNVTDGTTGSSGYARGMWLNFTASGAKTGTAETNGFGIDMTVTGNSPFARALTLYTNATGTTTIGTMNAIDIYMDDEAGTVTQTGKRAINIGIDHGNDKGTCDMIVFRCHGGTVDNVLKFTDTTGSPYTNFISIDGICGFVSAETNTTFAGDGVKIAIDVGGSTYYLRACSAFS